MDFFKEERMEENQTEQDTAVEEDKAVKCNVSKINIQGLSEKFNFCKLFRWNCN